MAAVTSCENTLYCNLLLDNPGIIFLIKLCLLIKQTRDEVESLHNCLEFSQPLSCLYQAMQTRKTFSIAFIK